MFLDKCVFLICKSYTVGCSLLFFSFVFAVVENGELLSISMSQRFRFVTEIPRMPTFARSPECQHLQRKQLVSHCVKGCVTCLPASNQPVSGRSPASMNPALTQGQLHEAA